MQYHQRHFQLRTRETHKSHCSSLEGPLHEHIATTYGLWRDAVLNELEYFHVTEGLVPDVMHDLLEGVVPLCVKFLLKHFVDMGIVHIHELNRRIECFKFGPMDVSGRPRGNITSAQLNTGELKQSGKYIQDSCIRTYVHSFIECAYILWIIWYEVPIKTLYLHALTATKMWSLARFLPLILGDLVPEEEEHWLHFLELRSIMDFLLAPSASGDIHIYVCLQV